MPADGAQRRPPARLTAADAALRAIRSSTIAATVSAALAARPALLLNSRRRRVCGGTAAAQEGGQGTHPLIFLMHVH